MNKKNLRLALICLLLLAGIGWAGAAAAQGGADDSLHQAGLAPQQMLGKFLFFDKHLSEPRGLSCSGCHGPGVGFTGPVSVINATLGAYPGAVPGRFGNRKPPSAAYAGESPVLFYDNGQETWTGGMFWDGRATGWTSGDPLADQAKGPLLNPLEQNNPSPKAVVDKVLKSRYRALFQEVCGDVYDVDAYFDCIANSIASYERSAQVNPFSSKYDAWLQGRAVLSAQEELGRQLFQGKAKCSGCHISTPGLNGEPPLFTDFTYDNLGIPKNPLNPFYYEPEWNPLGPAWIDEGLGAFLRDNTSFPYEAQIGKFKVPTLRNVDKRPNDLFVKAYGHNGFFKSLKEIVHFYNTRDVLPVCGSEPDPGPYPGKNCWPAPEVAENMNTNELGNLGLSDEEEDAIVAFLKTLTDAGEGHHHE